MSFRMLPIEYLEEFMSLFPNVILSIDEDVTHVPGSFIDVLVDAVSSSPRELKWVINVEHPQELWIELFDNVYQCPGFKVLYRSDKDELTAYTGSSYEDLPYPLDLVLEYASLPGDFKLAVVPIRTFIDVASRGYLTVPDMLSIIFNVPHHLLEKLVPGTVLEGAGRLLEAFMGRIGQPRRVRLAPVTPCSVMGKIIFIETPFMMPGEDVVVCGIPGRSLVFVFDEEYPCIALAENILGEVYILYVGVFKTPLNVMWRKMEEIPEKGEKPYPVKVKQYKTFTSLSRVEEPVREKLREVREMLTERVQRKWMS